jgi:hypothetical protein
MALAIPDWSRETLRKSDGFEVRFHNRAHADGSVAAAGEQARPLTIADIAILAALETPSVLPAALREQVADCDRVVSRLVLDGFIEVRRGRRFVTGAAVMTVASQSADIGAPASHISELALHYALLTQHLPQRALADRLYAFNSLPRLAAPDPSPRRFTELTGIDPESPSPRLGGKAWRAHTSGPWLYFRRGSPYEAHFKMYLCPRPRAVSSVIGKFADVLAGNRDSTFKIAYPAPHLARADKIVAYFENFEAVQRTIAALAPTGLDAPSQPVPFSAPVPGTQLLTWGVDPPSLSSQRASSWRSWVTRQVAECAHALPTGTAPDEKLTALKTALELRDIDPVQWLPRQRLISRTWRLEL